MNFEVELMNFEADLMKIEVELVNFEAGLTKIEAGFTKIEARSGDPEKKNRACRKAVTPGRGPYLLPYRGCGKAPGRERGCSAPPGSTRDHRER
jgi:hypothetical protein